MAFPSVAKQPLENIPTFCSHLKVKANFGEVFQHLFFWDFSVCFVCLMSLDWFKPDNVILF